MSNLGRIASVGQPSNDILNSLGGKSFLYICGVASTFEDEMDESQVKAMAQKALDSLGPLSNFSEVYAYQVR